MRARARRTWTIGDERLRADVSADMDLVITTMHRGTVEHPKGFGVYEHMTIPAAFFPVLREMLASLRVERCGVCGSCVQGGPCEDPR